MRELITDMVHLVMGHVSVIDRALTEVERRSYVVLYSPVYAYDIVKGELKGHNEVMDKKIRKFSDDGNTDGYFFAVVRKRTYSVDRPQVSSVPDGYTRVVYYNETPQFMSFDYAEVYDYFMDLVTPDKWVTRGIKY